MGQLGQTGTRFLCQHCWKFVVPLKVVIQLQLCHVIKINNMHQKYRCHNFQRWKVAVNKLAHQWRGEGGGAIVLIGSCIYVTISRFFFFAIWACPTDGEVTLCCSSIRNTFLLIPSGRSKVLFFFILCATLTSIVAEDYVHTRENDSF